MPTYVDVEPIIKWCTYCADDDIVRVDRIVMANILRNAPTVDAVEVVRCKDCEYYIGEEKYCINDIFARPSGYCYFARRKEDAETN